MTSEVASDGVIYTKPLLPDVSEDFASNPHSLNQDDSFEIESDNEENHLVVLEPEHPLMSRFQKALNGMLLKQLEKSEINLHEIIEAVKKKRESYIDLGNKLFNAQQDLARNQGAMQKYVDAFNETNKKRKMTEANLVSLQENLDHANKLHRSEANVVRQLTQNLDDLSLRTLYIKQSRSELDRDIVVVRTMAERRDNYTKEEEAKMKQDLVMDRLVQNLERTREETLLYEAQLASQGAEKAAAQQALKDAENHLDSLFVERNRLLCEWHTSVYTLQHRNEIYTGLSKRIEERETAIKNYNQEMETFQKTISDSQRHNEHLTLMLQRSNYQIQACRKQFNQSQNKLEGLQQEYATLTRILTETETLLKRATGDAQCIETEARQTQELYAREMSDCLKIEHQIEDVMRDKMRTQNICQYVLKLSFKLREQNRELKKQLATVENDNSRVAMERALLTTQIVEGKKRVVLYEESSKERCIILDKLETKIGHNASSVVHKQDTVDRLTKELEKLIARQGKDLSPMEATIKSLHKSISVVQEKIDNLQQIWLRDQQSLVQDRSKHEKIIVEVSRLNKQITILRKKKIRLEGNIKWMMQDFVAAQNSLHGLSNDIERLNTYTFYQRDKHDTLQEDTRLIEIDFVNSLRLLERESNQLTEKLEVTIQEKEDMLLEMIDIEVIIQHWEKRMQLFKEMKMVVNSDSVLNELHSMKSEIHRMKVRSCQLEKMQERLVQDLEKSVYRRETILNRGESLQQITHKLITKGAVNKKIDLLKKNIASVEAGTVKANLQYGSTLENHKEVFEDLEEWKKEVENARIIRDEALELEQTANDTKTVNFMVLYFVQHKAQHYTRIRDHNYIPMYKLPTRLQNDNIKQNEITHSLEIVIDRVITQFPQTLPILRPWKQLVQLKLEIFKEEEHCEKL